MSEEEVELVEKVIQTNIEEQVPSIALIVAPETTQVGV